LISPVSAMGINFVRCKGKKNWDLGKTEISICLKQ
jgi:hypothetical protein